MLPHRPVFGVFVLLTTTLGVYLATFVRNNHAWYLYTDYWQPIHLLASVSLPCYPAPGGFRNQEFEVTPIRGFSNQGFGIAITVTGLPSEVLVYLAKKKVTMFPLRKQNFYL